VNQQFGEKWRNDNSTTRSLEAHGKYDVIGHSKNSKALWDCSPVLYRSAREVKCKMAERPFSVAVLFGLVWITLAFFAGFVEFPAWSNLNTGLCFLAICVCVMNYVNEYLGKFPLSYR